MDTFWSPEPVPGYRVWNVFRDRLSGFFSVWPRSELEAKCTLPEAETAAPHLNDVCECGIYAARDPEWLKSHFIGSEGPQVAMGRVELSGRVIEHTDGYRAQQARVVEIAVRTRDGVYHFDDAEQIESLFANPHVAIARHGHGPLPADADLAGLVTKEHRWT